MNEQDELSEQERTERRELLLRETQEKIDQLDREERLTGRTMEITLLRAEFRKRLVRLQNGNLDAPVI